MDEGCAKGCAGIVAVIIAISLLFSGMAYAGMAAIIGIEYLALSFTWIGAGNPVTGWVLLGIIAGGVAGLFVGLERAGRKVRPLEMTGACVVLGALFLFLGTRAADTGDFGAPRPQREQIAEEEAAPKFTVAITAERLNVRAAPSTGAEVIATVPKDATLGVLSSQGRWYEVLVASERETRRGWISRTYAKRLRNAERGRIAENDPPEPQRLEPQSKRRDPPPSNAENETDAGGRISPSEESASRSSEAPDKDRSEPEVFMAVEQMPEPVGGMAALQKSVEYPPFAQRAGIEGRVVVQFIVDEQGNVTEPKMIASPHELLSKEALRVIKETKFTPGKHRGQPVKVRMSLPVAFALRETEQEEQEPATAPTSISFRPNASATAEMDGNRFTVTVLSGIAARTPDENTRVELEVQQQSVNFEGEWVRWSPILKESYLVDDQGRRYNVQRSASDNLQGGPVQPGGTRTGTIVFDVGRPPADLGRMTLHFAYFPYRGTQSVQVPFSIQ